MPIVALFLVLAAVIGGIVYFREAEITPPMVATSTTETVVDTTPSSSLSETTTVTPPAPTPIVTETPVTPPATESPKPPVTTETPTPTPTPAPAAQVITIHKPYRTPAKVQESITVNFTVKAGVVTAVSSSYNEGNGENGYQKRFDGAYQTQVVGKKLTDISLSRVGGASLTSGAFNEAVKDAIAQTAS